MNLGDARTQLKRYLNETKAGHWTDTKLNDVIREANYQCYMELCSVNPTHFKNKAAFTYAANTESIDLSAAGALNDEWFVVEAVWVMSDPGAPSPTNLPEYCEPIQQVSDLYDLSRTDASEWVAADIVRRRFLVVGKELFLSPIPTKQLNMYIHYLPRPFRLAGDSDHLLSHGNGTVSILQEAHELVVLLAAIRAYTIVNDDPSSLVGVYNSMRSATISALGMDQQNQEPAQLRAY